MQEKSDKGKPSVIKTVVLGIIFIAMTFLLGGSGFFTQSCLLEGYLTDLELNTVTMQWNYLAEAVGIGLFILGYYKFPKLTGSRMIYVISLILSGVSLALMLLIPQAGIIIASGIIFNVAFGFWFGWYYSFMLARFPFRHRCLYVGLSTGLGSLGTYFLSTFQGGTFLYQKGILWFYLCLILIITIIVNVLGDLPKDNLESLDFGKKMISSERKKDVFLILGILILLSLLTSFSSEVYVPFLKEANIDYVYTRAFYIIGLVIVGLVLDINLEAGIAVTIVSMLFPLLFVALRGNLALANILYCVQWIMLAFPGILRFAIIGKSPDSSKMIPFASICLLIDRIVICTSQFITGYLWEHQTFTMILVFLLFGALITLFLLYYRRKTEQRYQKLISQTKRDEKEEFIRKYGLTATESLVCMAIIESDKDLQSIADSLYMSKRTLQRHLANVYTKTKTTKRVELSLKFYKGKTIGA